MVVAELATKLGNNKRDLLTDTFDQFNKILTSNGKKEWAKSSYLLSHLQHEVCCRLPTIFGKENKWQGYLLIQNNGDLHNTLYWALIDKKKESSNKIINRQNTPIEKSDLDAASEGAIPNNFNLIQSLMHKQIHGQRKLNNQGNLRLWSWRWLHRTQILGNAKWF